MEVSGSTFIYRMAGVDKDFDPKYSLWSHPLEGKDRGSSSPSIGQFFESASAFIAREEYMGVRQGLHFYGINQGEANLSSIIISIEKHGAFYHPARVDVGLCSGETFPLVLNTAVSLHGIRVMDNEAAALTRLAREFPDVDLPRVFAAGKVQSDSGVFAFFLAQWFDEYLEFHISWSPEGEGQHLVLWERDGGVIPLRSPDYFDIYGQAAEILTRLYNLETFEQVFPWHHAAGDFVVKPLDQGFDVRLITVRNYDSMVGGRDRGAELEIEEVYRALLFFFVNLSLRVRLDRMDGIGEFCLVDERVVPHIITGFFRGLESKGICGMIGSGLCRSFLDFAAGFDSSELAEVLYLTLAASNQGAPEMDLLKKNLAAHATLLVSHLGKIWEKELFY